MASDNDSATETEKSVDDKPTENVENQFGEASSVDKVTLNNKDSVKETAQPVNDEPTENVENQFGEASSVDKVTLNNKIISMRSTVKKSKVRILTKLIRNIKQLNGKISREGKQVNVDKNKRKHGNLVEEMKVIKALKPDTISRFVLGNTCTFAELNNKGFQSTEARALARFSDENLIQDVVKKFRDEHSDWKSLAAFVQTQSSGRQIKKKSRNKKSKAEKEETKTNIKAKQAMVSTFLHGKGDNTNTEDPNSGSDVNVPHSKSSPNKNKTISNESKELEPKLDTNQETTELDPSSGTDSQNLNTNSKQKTDSSNTNKTVNKLNGPKKGASATKQQNKNSAAMVVKKISLDNFDDDIKIDVAPKIEDGMGKLFGNECPQDKDSELFFTDRQGSSFREEEDDSEKGDQKEDDSEFVVSGNHSMFLSLSGGDSSSFRETQSFRGGRGRGGSRGMNPYFSESRRQNPNFERHQNNFGRGRFPDRGRRGGRPSMQPLTKTFRESRDGPTNDVSKQKLSDKSNIVEEKLHPSWEASRKRKEQAASISAFQGKKIKFDDDD